MTRDPLTLVAAFLLGTVAVARATRLITADAWPPMQNLRQWWLLHQGQRDADATTDRHLLDPRSWTTGWGPLLDCPFCAAPYVAAGNLALAWYSDLATWWWLLNIWAAVSYLAAMVVVRDEPPAED